MLRFFYFFFSKKLKFFFVFSPLARGSCGRITRASVVAERWQILDWIRRCATPAVPRRRPSGSGTRPPETFSAASATKRTKPVPPSIELRRRWSVPTSSSSDPDYPSSGSGHPRPASIFSPAGKTRAMWPSVSFGRSGPFLRSSIRRLRNSSSSSSSSSNNNIITPGWFLAT